MNSLDIYVRDVGRYPTLTWEEQLALFFRLPDPAAERLLVEANLRLVLTVVTRAKRPNESLDDLVQIGNLALLTAVKKFDTDRGCKFTTYLTKAIMMRLRKHRQRKRLVCGSLQAQLSSTSNSADPAEAALQNDQVRTILSRVENLSEFMRSILTLRHAGKSHGEISRIVGLGRESIRLLLDQLFHELTHCESA